MSLETKSVESFATKFTKSMGDGQVQLPDNFHSSLGENTKISIRVSSRPLHSPSSHLCALKAMMEPLAAFGNSKIRSNTNLSRTISFSILDANQKEVAVQTDGNTSIEIVIPRDPNLSIPPLLLHNVTALNSSAHNLTLHFHHFVVNVSLPVSVHWEMEPLNTSLAYLFVYRFDQLPQLNESTSNIDGWTLFCPSGESPSLVLHIRESIDGRSDERECPPILRRQ